MTERLNWTELNLLDDAEDEVPIFWPPDAKNWVTGKDSDAERLRARGDRGNREWDSWMVSSTQWTWAWANSGDGEREAWHAAVHGVGHDFKTEQQQLFISASKNEILRFQFSSVAQSCPTLCDPMNRSMPGLPVHQKLPEFTQTHVRRVSDAIQPSNPLSSPSPPAPNPSQHQSLFQWVSSLH